ncbi:DNA polymerase beta thumb [uncultured archaeon]|nr:DNA polymerase beta thumb [uncultured archaeon]
MEKVVVFKKGRRVVTRKGEVVIHLANKLTNYLKPFCRRIEIVGSIRRKEKNPVDIDIVLIPKDREKLEEFVKKKGKFLQGGEKKSRWRIQGVNVELYYTDLTEWGAALLAYSSKFGAGIGLRMIAKRKGFKLSQHGLFRKGKRIAGKSEEEIYHKLGRPWKKPENR